MLQSNTKMGLWMTTALVVGNMIGSGIFMLPATLAQYGGISLLGWAVSTIGALLLAKVFGYLSQLMPAKGGPYAYSKAGFGDFIAFLVAWGYWISIWTANAAIVLSLVGYLSVFFPAIKTSPGWSIVIGLSTIWFLAWINSKGVKEAGFIQVVTTILKLLPIFSIAIFGLLVLNIEHFTPFNLSQESNFKAITITAAMTLWAFLGVESATIPADNVENPTKTIPKATMLGTVLAALAYVLGSISVMGLIEPETLQHSHAPFADAAEKLWGENGRYVVAFGATVSCFGALNGWTLVLGQTPLAAANDNLFPKIFKRLNKNGMPSFGIIVSSLLISLLLSMNFSESLAQQYEFIILLSTLTCLVPYLFSAAGLVVISIERKLIKKNQFSSKLIIALMAFAYSVWAVIGSGSTVVYWGFVLLILGIPFYILMIWNQKK